MIRHEFVAPLLAALGWSTANASPAGAFYSETGHENPIKAEHNGGSYICCHTEGARSFFVACRGLQHDISKDADHAFQLRRYAWSANVKLSVITNFREFAVYDCRIKPRKNDSPEYARVLYFTYKDYAQRWSEIASLFSREAVLLGALDSYGEGMRAKPSNTPVNVALLEDIESWREKLAVSIASRNPHLSQRDLNHAVQLTIDRVLFLRICEDRGIEPYEQLLSLTRANGIYKELCSLFNEADTHYNSGLFHFSHEPGRTEAPNDLTFSLDIDDETLKLIISRLYYPESVYEFSVIPADVLGHVYEQLLGKGIHLTSTGEVLVEEKPVVRKAGGVYYTPTYVVRFMARQILSKLLEGKTPEEVAALKIADPACGSGYFLLQAFEYLLDWHRQKYIASEPQNHQGRLYRGTGGEWRLTAAERKRILLNNIYGVDIDEQAVEVTRLSLLLKVLEGETRETLALQLPSHSERALPDLSNNIKCGNALIGPDYYGKDKHRQTSSNQERNDPICAFDWRAEFPQVFGKESNGFSAIIGNPPYIRVRTLKELYPEQVSYLEKHYECATHVWDIYVLFFELAINLLHPGGLVSFIVPVQTLHQPNCQSLRQLLQRKTAIHTVVDLSQIRVFQDALVKNCILVCEKGTRESQEIEVLRPETPRQLCLSSGHKWPQKAVSTNPGFSLKVSLLSPQKRLCDKLREQSWELEELCYVTFGLRSCAREKGGGTKDRLITTDAEDPCARPYLEGRNIKRFMLNSPGRYIRYIPEEMYNPRSSSLFEARKIVSQSLLSRMRLVATLDDESNYVEQSLLCIVPHGVLTDRVPSAALPLEYLLGVLNSRLQSFYFASYLVDYSLGGGLVHATPGVQSKLIVPRASSAQMLDVVGLVNNLLRLHSLVSSVKTTQDRQELTREISTTDNVLDSLLCEVYGLTEAERHTIYSATVPAPSVM
ncbi:MAG TPA: TaqI-like C-terminal specificity domain-containing protein [Chloroflexia bacterium]